jgi:hypothetical protein
MQNTIYRISQQRRVEGEFYCSSLPKKRNKAKTVATPIESRQQSVIRNSTALGIGLLMLSGVLVAVESHENTNFTQDSETIPKIEKKFFGPDIANSKLTAFKGQLFVAKAHGGEVAEVHDKILRDVGLVTDEVPDLIKIRASIEPILYSDYQKTEPIEDVIGQARKKIDVQKLDRVERENFIKANFEKFVSSSMMGVGISDLTQNPNNLVKFEGKITAIDVDATNFPIIPYYIFDRFGIDRETIFESAKKFYKSPQYEPLKKLKLDSVLKACGEDSDFYKKYLENFKMMEKYLDQEKGYNQDYNPHNVYFGNILNIFKDDDTYIKQNIVDLNIGGPSKAFPTLAKLDDKTTHYLMARISSEPTSVRSSKKLDGETKDSREL